jgi:hypothetical protein
MQQQCDIKQAAMALVPPLNEVDTRSDLRVGGAGKGDPFPDKCNMSSTAVSCIQAGLPKDTRQKGEIHHALHGHRMAEGNPSACVQDLQLQHGWSSSSEKNTLWEEPRQLQSSLYVGDPVIGTWCYCTDSKPFSVSSRGTLLRYDEELATGGMLSGYLRPEGYWLQCQNLQFFKMGCESQPAGTMRLRFLKKLNVLVVNFLPSGQSTWGSDVFAKKAGSLTLEANLLGERQLLQKLGPDTFVQGAVELEDGQSTWGSDILAKKTGALMLEANLLDDRQLLQKLCPDELVQGAFELEDPEQPEVAAPLSKELTEVGPQKCHSNVSTTEGSIDAAMASNTGSGRCSECSSKGGSVGRAVPSAASSDSKGGSPGLHLVCAPKLPPRFLRLLTPNGQRKCEGLYALIDGDMANSQPFWKQCADGGHWLFSDESGRWCVAGADVQKNNFDRSAGWLFQQQHHNGEMPHDISGPWWRWDGSEFQEDTDIAVIVVIKRRPLDPALTTCSTDSVSFPSAESFDSHHSDNSIVCSPRPSPSVSCQRSAQTSSSSGVRRL